MWQTNPINWTNLNWIKNALVQIVSGQSTDLTVGEIDLAREILDVIADDYPQYRDQSLALLHTLPSTNQLWVPRSGGSLNYHLGRAKQDQTTFWWELYYFLNKFEERPAGRIILASQPRRVSLSYLEDQVRKGNHLAIPDYIRTHLENTGKPPKLYIRHIVYSCLTHQTSIIPNNPYPSYSYHEECPRTIYQAGPNRTYGGQVPLNKPCVIIPVFTGRDDWLSSATFPDNLFSFKKRHYPSPIQPKDFLDKFFQHHSQNPAYLMFKQEIEDFFRNVLAIPVEVIALLNIPPDPPHSWRIQGIEWKELVKLTNLQTRWLAISNYTSKDVYDRNMGFLYENHSPQTIISFAAVTKDRFGNFERLNNRQGIVIRDDYKYHSGRAISPAGVELVTFG